MGGILSISWTVHYLLFSCVFNILLQLREQAEANVTKAENEKICQLLSSQH